jgi:hypothetical protein
MPQFQTLLFSFLAILLFACASPEHSSSELPPAVDYPALKTHIETERDSLSRLYLANPGEATIQQARKYVLKRLSKDLFPQWYGTGWDFNGITQVPQKGQIACGYFVSTLLRDVGFRVERARMAQQASLYIIRSLSPSEHRKDWSRITTAEFARRVGELPQGLYVVGLDIHTGFVLHDEEDVWFVHSSYGDPSVVVKEKAAESAILAQSNRFVLGRVDNDWLMKKWLKGEKVVTVTG